MPALCTLLFGLLTAEIMQGEWPSGSNVSIGLLKLLNAS